MRVRRGKRGGEERVSRGRASAAACTRASARTSPRRSRFCVHACYLHATQCPAINPNIPTPGHPTASRPGNPCRPILPRQQGKARCGRLARRALTMMTKTTHPAVVLGELLGGRQGLEDGGLVDKVSGVTVAAGWGGGGARNERGKKGVRVKSGSRSTTICCRLPGPHAPTFAHGSRVVQLQLGAPQVLRLADGHKVRGHGAPDRLRDAPGHGRRACAAHAGLQGVPEQGLHPVVDC